jgi:hypothetical protein
MDPQLLIGPETSIGSPAPYWLLVTLKVLGFALHMGPMHLWFMGIILALSFSRSSSEHLRKFGNRLMQVMPVIISVGVNLGIVPLLFMQVSYYRVFYPATILIAWQWFAIVMLLIVSYYGIYYYVVGLRTRMTGLHRFAGWLSAIVFIVIGFIFSTGLNLMVHVEAWPEIWRETSVAGAPTGTALAHSIKMLPRWLMLIGLALTTVSAYMALDAGVFAGKETAEYRRRITGTAFKLAIVGAVVFWLMGAWYIFGTLDKPVLDALMGGSMILLALITGASPALTVVMIALMRRKVTALMGILTAAVQFVVLLINAITRQVVQNLNLAPYFNPAGDAPNYQWDVLVLFLLLFVGGIVVIWWMVAKVWKTHSAEVRGEKTS